VADDQKMCISVVIPVYNSEKSLPELYNRLKASLEPLAHDFEIIMVEDCSGDRSWDIVETLSQQDERVKGIQLSRNFGQHNALLCGIRAAQYDVIVTLDDDLQHPPEEIPKLLDKLAEGYDVVYGTPHEQQHSYWRNMASRVIRLALQNAMGIKLARHVSPFRAFHTRLRDAFDEYQNPRVSVDVLLSWGTTRFTTIKVEYNVRQYGQSNYTFTKLVRQAFNIILSYSILPLRFASIAGFGFMAFGLLLLLYVSGRYLIEGYSIPGFPFLASTILIFSGVQLFALGIIGEYLAMIFFRTLGRPTYVVKQQIKQGTKQDE